MHDRLKVGVLALQGDFERHLFHLALLNVDCLEVRQSKDLKNLDGLIIPGGESTTINRLIDKFSFRHELEEFVREKAVWGTCAGMIMLADKVDDDRIQPLGVMNISVIRNGYGRQLFSFFAEIEVDLSGDRSIIPASFIRAPMVEKVGSAVKILAKYDNRPVLLSQKNCLVSSFHSELHNDQTLVKYFLDNFVMTSEKAL